MWLFVALLLTAVHITMTLMELVDGVRIQSYGSVVCHCASPCYIIIVVKCILR